MMLGEAMWERLSPLLPPWKPRTGRPSLDHRRFIEAVLGLARTGAPSGAALAAPALRGGIRRLGPDHRRAPDISAGDGLGRTHARQHRHPCSRRCRRGATGSRRSGARLFPTSAVVRRPQLRCRMIGAADQGFSTIIRQQADDPSAQQRGPEGPRGLHRRCDGHGRPRWKPAAVIADKAYSAGTAAPRSAPSLTRSRRACRPSWRYTWCWTTPPRTRRGSCTTG